MVGEVVVGLFYDVVEVIFIMFIDIKYIVSVFYGMVNVLMGVFIDEEGKVVCFDEGMYMCEYLVGSLIFGMKDYLLIVCDWVVCGVESEFVQELVEIVGVVGCCSDVEVCVDVVFCFGMYFEFQGDWECVVMYWCQV